ncbi:MAG: class I tRNA ligase family protein, partial [Nanoarchaeota archaeon]
MGEAPKRYDPAVEEEVSKKLWEEHEVYKFDRDNTEKDKVFSIDTPPPYASAAHLHIGHAMHYSHFEFIARYKRMKGFNVLFPMGFDDNGLPTERYVEKKHQINKKTISKPDFVKLCLEETQRVGATYKKMWTDVGLSVDWSLLYSTINEKCQRISQRSFIDLYKKKLVERRNDPIMWDTHFQTAIAQADLEDMEKNSQFIDIAFTGEDGEELIISTTRPELIPACVGLFAHPDDDRYRKLVGTQATVPLCGYKVPIMTDETVDIEKGTGLMMVCTFGDIEDIEKWRKYGLDTRLILNQDGTLNERAGKYEGLRIKEARKAIIADLEQEGHVKDKKQIRHTVNVSERSKEPIEFQIKPQWFIKVTDHKAALLEKVKKVTWHPAHMRKRA